MTPLAYRIIKDMTLPVKRRSMTFLEPELLAHFREEVHCFEVTAIEQLIRDMTEQMLRAFRPSIAGAFLPAERTWLEWSAPDEKMPKGRVGVMLVRCRDGFADVFLTNGVNAGRSQFGRLALSDELAKIFAVIDPERFDNERLLKVEKKFIQLHIPPNGRAYGVGWLLYGILLLINTPHVTSRTQHDPHRALAREVLAHRKTLGIFPLQAWTEITLKPGVGDSEEQHDAVTGTTGTVALHWTRAHRRRIHGVWTLISDYWSGDGSLGIRQSRYKVVPPTNQETSS
jgi:hypothetical protein